MPPGPAAQNGSGAAFWDAVHTRANWGSHRVPERNFNVGQSLASLDRMAAILKDNNAQLWIGHETSEVPLRQYAAAYYE